MVLDSSATIALSPAASLAFMAFRNCACAVSYCPSLKFISPELRSDSVAILQLQLFTDFVSLIEIGQGVLVLALVVMGTADIIQALRLIGFVMQVSR